ncbi:MAG: hypothetical protein ACOVK2_03030 [Candidatus Fonsibacter sp.]
MAINPTTLKALIDTQITNETVDFAITPTEVGSRMKDTIDYTTEQIALKEDTANKQTDLTASATKFPTVNAVNTGLALKENLTNKSTDVALGNSDTLYPTQNAVKTYVDNNAGGLTFVSVDNNSLDGNGTPSTPLKNKVYYRTSQIFASGGGAPNRVKNFFSGMQLPSGVTETFTRVSSGIYRATYSGVDTIADLDLTDFSKLFHFSFSSMPTNTGSDLKIQQIGSTNTGGIRTIFVEFHNLPSGVLTDNFNGYLYYEVKFFQ